MRIAFREAVFRGLEAHLRGAFPELNRDQIIRNPANPVDGSDALPQLRCHDGGQTPGTLSTPGEIGYLVRWAVEGWVQTVREEELGSAINEQHARVCEAMSPPNPVVIETTEFPIELWLDEAEMNVNLLGVEEAQHSTGAWAQEFLVEVRMPRGVPFVEIPDPED